MDDLPDPHILLFVHLNQIQNFFCQTKVALRLKRLSFHRW